MYLEGVAGVLVHRFKLYCNDPEATLEKEAEGLDFNMLF